MNHIHTLRRHWPIAVAALIFLLGSFHRVTAAYTPQPVETQAATQPDTSPIFMLSIYAFILIVAVLVLTNMHRNSIKPSTPSKTIVHKSKSKTKKSKSKK